MAEIVASAVASEAVSRISSLVSGNKTSHQSVEDKAERLEMAVLKIQSIVAVSEDLKISHLPLLQWKAKLKRVATEGDSLLQVHKKKLMECNGVSSSTSGISSLSQFLINAAKRFVPFYSKEDELSDITLQRFERFAEGADSFFRLVESSGHPRRNISLPSLTRFLLAGNSMEFFLQRPGSSDHILLWPWLDPDAENEVEAYLMVSREDEVMWHNNLKMGISFRLSEAADILAIAMSCLDLLPPQFGATREAIKGLLNQTIASQSCRHSNMSAKSMWCCQVTQKYMRSDCGSPHNPHHQCPNTGMLLPHLVIRLTVFCYALPATSKSCSPLNKGFPLKLSCHMSPYLLPEKHSSQFLQVEQNVISEMLPKVDEGFYDDQRQATVEYKREIWCPQSAMYCSVAPETTQPLTMSKVYMMEYSSTPSRRRKRRRASQIMSK